MPPFSGQACQRPPRNRTSALFPAPPCLDVEDGAARSTRIVEVTVACVVRRSSRCCCWGCPSHCRAPSKPDRRTNRRARQGCTSCSKPNGSAGCVRIRSRPRTSATPATTIAGRTCRPPQRRPRTKPTVRRSPDSTPIDAATLSEADRLNQDLFRRQTQASLDNFEYGAHLIPLSHRSGLTSIAPHCRGRRVPLGQGLRAMARAHERRRGADGRR